MCDTVVAFGAPGENAGVWLGKNSDREPGEAQLVEVHPRRGNRRAAAAGSGRLRVTHIEIDDVDETFAVVISRPHWMWGAEMGVNEKGVVIGNEAVFTSERLDDTGLTGMDLLRLALERAASARDAVDVITTLLHAHGQGGRMGHRNVKFTYASSFLIADATEAWVLETAGRRWAAERVIGGVRSISNALTIGVPDLVDDAAKARVDKAGGFAKAYDSALMSTLAGARHRRACTARAGPSFAAMSAALRSHDGRAPSDGLVMTMPCAHASLWPTRAAGQTTASMIARVTNDGVRVWMTGTSSPCLSVFKPVTFDVDTAAGGSLGGAAGDRFDDASLWWRHERLHRAVLARSAEAHASVVAVASLLEEGARDATRADDVRAVWNEHRELVDEWRASVERDFPLTRGGLFEWYWRRASRREGVPA